jgi:hypothetical protein
MTLHFVIKYNPLSLGQLTIVNLNPRARLSLEKGSHSDDRLYNVGQDSRFIGKGSWINVHQLCGLCCDIILTGCAMRAETLLKKILQKTLLKIKIY